MSLTDASDYASRCTIDILAVEMTGEEAGDPHESRLRAAAFCDSEPVEITGWYELTEPGDETALHDATCEALKEAADMLANRICATFGVTPDAACDLAEQILSPLITPDPQMTETVVLHALRRG